MRLRTTRTVSAPTQCTSLNGTTQYYSKTSPAGASFTTTWTQMAWIYLTSYPTVAAGIMGRRNGGTEGWGMYISTSGCLVMSGCRVAANSKAAVSTQSVPLNRWVHVAMSMDMTAGATSGATWYFDGVSVPGVVTQTGTATAIVQGTTAMVVGALESAGTYPFPGKIAQAAVFSAVLSQATIRAMMNQTLTGSETNLVSAYSFNNTINDLSANANNLTAVASAVATDADSPFGLNSYQTATGTLDYALVQAVTFSTDTTVTVQVPWGCTIPTSGGVTTSAYSSVKAPYGWVIDNRRWDVSHIQFATRIQVSPVANTWYNLGGKLVVPVGSWILGHKTTVYSDRAVAGDIDSQATVSTTSSTETDIVATTTSRSGGGTIITTTHQLAEYPIVTSAATDYYINGRTRVASGANFIMGGNDKFYVIPAGL